MGVAAKINVLTVLLVKANGTFLIICCVSGSGRGRCFGEQALFERCTGPEDTGAGDADPGIALEAFGGRGVRLAA